MSEVTTSFSVVFSWCNLHLAHLILFAIMSDERPFRKKDLVVTIANVRRLMLNTRKVVVFCDEFESSRRHNDS